MLWKERRTYSMYFSPFSGLILRYRPLGYFVFSSYRYIQLYRYVFTCFLSIKSIKQGVSLNTIESNLGEKIISSRFDSHYIEYTSHK